METQKGTIAAGSSMSVSVGKIRQDRSIIVRYTAKRDSGQQYGKFVAMNRVTSIDVSNEYTGDDLGLTCTGSIDGENIQLTMSVDSSSVYGVDFNVTIENIRI